MFTEIIKYSPHIYYFCHMDNDKTVNGTDEAQLKALLDNPNTPEKLKESIKKKLKYINKPIRK